MTNGVDDPRVYVNVPLRTLFENGMTMPRDGAALVDALIGGYVFSAAIEAPPGLGEKPICWFGWDGEDNKSMSVFTSLPRQREWTEAALEDASSYSLLVSGAAVFELAVRNEIELLYMDIGEHGFILDGPQIKYMASLIADSDPRSQILISPTYNIDKVRLPVGFVPPEMVATVARATTAPEVEHAYIYESSTDDSTWGLVVGVVPSEHAHSLDDMMRRFIGTVRSASEKVAGQFDLLLDGAQRAAVEKEIPPVGAPTVDDMLQSGGVHSDTSYANDELHSVITRLSSLDQSEVMQLIGSALLGGSVYVPQSNGTDWIGHDPDGTTYLAAFTSSDSLGHWRAFTGERSAKSHRLVAGPELVDIARSRAAAVVYIDSHSPDSLALGPPQIAEIASMWRAVSPKSATEVEPEEDEEVERAEESPAPAAPEPEPVTEIEAESAPEIDPVVPTTPKIVGKRTDTIDSVQNAVAIVGPLLENHPDISWKLSLAHSEDDSADETIRALAAICWALLHNSEIHHGTTPKTELEQATLTLASYRRANSESSVRTPEELSEIANATCANCGHTAAQHKPVWIMWEHGEHTERECSVRGCGCHQFVAPTSA